MVDENTEVVEQGTAEVDQKETNKPNELVHNCKDSEFLTEPCPACAAERIAIASKASYVETMVITDAQLCPEKEREWKGLVFWCSKCESYEVFWHMKYCPMCATPVSIKSAELTKKIHAMNGANRR